MNHGNHHHRIAHRRSDRHCHRHPRSRAQEATFALVELGGNARTRSTEEIGKGRANTSQDGKSGADLYPETLETRAYGFVFGIEQHNCLTAIAELVVDFLDQCSDLAPLEFCRCHRASFECCGEITTPKMRSVGFSPHVQIPMWGNPPSTGGGFSRQY